MNGLPGDGGLDIVWFPSPDRLLVFRLSSQPG
jgi:hypothetical protein